jgi:hypothetical protein
MLPLLHRLSAAGFVADLGALLIVDAISWHRTRRIRMGQSSLVGEAMDRAPPARSVLGSMDVRSSRTTFLAGAAGLWAIACGATTPRDIGWTSPALMVAGGFIAMTGLMGRVRILRAGRAGLVIRYAARPSFVLSWAACQEVRPPRTLLGGWQIIGAARSRCLMPSDLLRNEWVLAAIVGSARLSFSGRSWVREHPQVPPRSGISPTG